MPEDALARGLVSALVAEDDLRDTLDMGPKGKARRVRAEHYRGRPHPLPRLLPRRPALALVEVHGAIRDGDWKLLCEYDGSKPLLYDLKRDPGESRDLAATEPRTVERLTQAVLAWHRAMPPDNGAALGAASPTGKKK